MTASSALLHDGMTAVPIPVQAQLFAEGLRLRRADGATQDWPVASLREIDRMPWELRIARAGAAQRLVVSDPAMIAALDMALAPWRKDEKAARWRRAAVTAFAVPLLGATLWFGWPPLADTVARTVPATWEQRLGDSIAASITQGTRRCVAPQGVAVLDRLSTRLAETAGLPTAPAVQVLDSGVVNAFAAPGRQVIIHRGLIYAASSPDEVAGVLAHEFGHLYHRHGLRNVARAIGVGAFVSILMGGSDFGAVAATLLVSVSYTRGFEAEADDFAADVLARSRIDAEGLARFFERMAGRGPRGSVAGYLDTHPDPAERATALRARRGAAVTMPALTPEEWLALRKICATTAS
ncbi:M48 family metallopeptidase [Roseomonas terrae]|uniref:M48 family metallopeptidase n=1 Tax=Neoroseomonas terrae TaxID=424799 RepID=A0ABS5EE13_9PROT|nr:M48 family metallopeptidase [Neoroseomonas terrae]